MNYRVSFQWVFGVLRHISGGLWSTWSHFRGFMEYRASFLRVSGVQGLISGGL